MDQAPKENPIINMTSKNNDPEYKKKLEKSYNICLEELKNPCENWEDILTDAKFTMDVKTGKQSTQHIFTLNYPDNIDIFDVNHSYIFRRTHFYMMFGKQSSRLKRDLINYWKTKGYYVNLTYDQESKRWKMILSWKN